MSHTHTIVAASLAEFRSKVADLNSVLNGTAISSGTVELVSPGKSSKGGKKDGASAPAQSAVTEVKQAVGATATVVEPDPEPEAEAEDDGLGDDEPTITRDDVKTLLIEVKNKFTNDPTSVGKLVAGIAEKHKYPAKKLADVKDEHLPELHAAAAKLLGK